MRNRRSVGDNGDADVLLASLVRPRKPPWPTDGAQLPIGDAETLGCRQLNDFVMVAALVPAHRRVERPALRDVAARVIDAASTDPNRPMQQWRSRQLDDRLPKRWTEETFNLTNLL